MKCLETGCRNDAVAGSNYCRKHRPGSIPTHKKTARKALKKTVKKAAVRVARKASMKATAVVSRKAARRKK